MRSFVIMLVCACFLVSLGACGKRGAPLRPAEVAAGQQTG
jgi:predicted small lipoprotein YifL